jgi:hypothetical protein
MILKTRVDLKNVWNCSFLGLLFEYVTIIRRREEASCAVAGTKMYVFGGVGEASVEVLEDSELDTPTWKAGPELPKVIARSCAATVDKDTVIVAGAYNYHHLLQLPSCPMKCSAFLFQVL